MAQKNEKVAVIVSPARAKWLPDVFCPQGSGRGL